MMVLINTKNEQISLIRENDIQTYFLSWFTLDNMLLIKMVRVMIVLYFALQDFFNKPITLSS